MFQGIGNVLLQFCVTSLLGVVSFAGDRIVESNKILPLKAICDNVTHATVGGLSWILILILTRKPVLPNVYSIVYCITIASFIDVDHFFAAKSWKLRDATHLDRRPFLHCTTLPILLWTLLMIFSKSFGSPGMSNYAWIILTSFLSHHIRDGSRRGLWLAPIGSTRPIPYYLYIALSMGLPYIIYWLMYLTAAPENFEEIAVYFYIACGITAGCLFLLFILVCVLFAKVRRLSSDGSNQLSRQANMMSDFCYTNPTIVPGEELSRRGYSMYSGTDHTTVDQFGTKKDYGVYHEARSKF